MRALATTRRLIGWGAAILAITAGVAACNEGTETFPHGPIAADIMAPLGEPLPTATQTQLEDFAAGRAVALRRFGISDGLGPSFNVTFCSACHERPVSGGSAGLYRNFAIAGVQLADGSFNAAESRGEAGGVVRMYSNDPALSPRPEVPEDVNLIAQRNPIPFFGVGLLAEISEEEILSREDPEDADGDGISGRANYDEGFVGRFGRKAQTVSIEGFIRGPLFNHLGITTDPLTSEQRAALPVDTTLQQEGVVDVPPLGLEISFAQAAAPTGPVIDLDGVADPELGSDDLFDLVSYAMLLAAPQFDEPDATTRRGAATFDAIGCASCHAPRLEGPRGPVPAYSDLLLHDMGEALADGVEQGSSTGAEFRTQPLWGLAAVGPYLHDGRAATIEAAILLHGGEATGPRDLAASLSPEDMADLVAFLRSLGGRSQFTAGLLPANVPIPAAGSFGAPIEPLTEAAAGDFLAGRALFDRDFGFDDGLGSPGFNGDSCRACHFDPVIGGAGPAGVNVMRFGSTDATGSFVVPEGGTILHKLTARLDAVVTAPPGTSVFELRQAPPLFGLGLVDRIEAETIAANADPDDGNGDGISGRVALLDDGSVGRFGWKAQLSDLADFILDAATAEMGLTTPFGSADSDQVPDPELAATDTRLIEFFVANLAPPPRSSEGGLVERGEAVFGSIGCSSCHIPTLEGPDGPVALYSDLLLHDVAPEGYVGVPEGAAAAREFRTPPLWGLRHGAPYMHDGTADSIESAITRHAGEAMSAVAAYRRLGQGELDALLTFLGSL